MPNELLLILSLILIYACVVLFYRFLGKSGLYCWTVLATIAANIEVLIVVNAFGMEQTLGNLNSRLKIIHCSQSFDFSNFLQNSV